MGGARPAVGTGASGAAAPVADPLADVPMPDEKQIQADVRKLKKSLQEIYDECYAHGSSWPFHQPVNPKEVCI